MTWLVFVLAIVSVGAVVYALVELRAAGQATDELRQVNHRDVLTGVPTRHAMVEAVTSALAGGTSRVGVTMIELTRFSAINETYGHEIGDAVLVAVAQKLEEQLGAGETLYRFGGPQFAVVTAPVRAERDLVDRIRTIQQAIDLPLRVGRDKVRITTVAGIAVVDAGKASPDELVADANVALQEALSRNEHQLLYEIEFRSRLHAATAEKRLRHALDNGEYELLYLPVVNLWDNDLVGFEALLRWADPERGMVSPREFLKVLDETGLIVPVGAWVIAEACRQSKVWQDEHPDRELTVTINVSPRQLMQSDFADVLRDAVRTSGVAPERLCLELAEGGVTRNTDAMWAALRGVKELGVQLALDDFGVGFSSLTYIRSFELDVVKIAPAFVRSVAKSRDDEAIVTQIVGLAHALNLTTVAEGVDAPEQAAALRSIGCDLAQGFHFSHPRPVAACEALIRRGRVIPGEDQKASIDWKGR